jgi:hypothetical protein
LTDCLSGWNDRKVVQVPTKVVFEDNRSRAMLASDQLSIADQIEDFSAASDTAFNQVFYRIRSDIGHQLFSTCYAQTRSHRHV